MTKIIGRKSHQNKMGSCLPSLQIKNERNINVRVPSIKVSLFVTCLMIKVLISYVLGYMNFHLAIKKTDKVHLCK